MSETTQPATRAFLETIIAERHNLAVEAVDAYADELATIFPCPGPQGRALSRLALESFIAGWHAGYDDGYGAGLKEGRDIERLGLKDEPSAA